MKNDKEKQLLIRKWSYRDILKDYAFYITLFISLAISLLGNEDILRSVIVAAGSAMVEMSGALLGIVLAGLAIIVAFMNKKYVDLIERFLGGFNNEFFAIKTVTLLTVLCLALGLGLILIGEPPAIVLRLVLFGALWSYSYLLWQVYELVKWLLSHAKLRAMQIKMEEKEGEEKQD